MNTRGMETWLGWVGVDPPGREGGQDFEEDHYFCFFCVDLHAISNAPVLTGMEHGLKFAWTHEQEG